jgi:tripartite-type tricarboxylate transporter receptor subunit TctC
MNSRLGRRLATFGVAVAMLSACGGAGTASTEPEGSTAASAGSSGDAAAWEPEFVDGVLQPLPDGFPSEPLTLLVVDEAGSQDGIYARHMQSALEDISPVRVNVVDRPDFGTYGSYEALVWMQEQPGGDEGYISAVLVDPGTTMDLLNTPVGEELGVDITSLNRVILTEQVPYAFYTRKDAPWGDSMEEFVAYAQEHPGELTFVGRGPGSGVDIGMADYLDRLGIEVETVVGGSFEEIAAAVAAGEGDFSMAGTQVVAQFYEDDQVEVLAVTGDAEATEPWTGVPRVQDITGQEEDPWGRNVGFYTTPETPDLHRDWLFELMKAATESEGFIADRTAIPGLKVVAVPHDEFEALAQSAYDIAYPLLEEQGLLDPSVQE